MKTRVLFVAEAVTLSHVVRPWILASSLPPDAFEVLFASGAHYAVCPIPESWQALELSSISPQAFMQRLARGEPVYTESELREYVAADVAMLTAHRPQVVVADFRLSMAVAARLLGIPFLAIVNAHWSPFVTQQTLSAPDLPVAKWLGFPVLDRVFRLVWSTASKAHCRSINRIRSKHGMVPYQGLSEYYCDADWVMYADPPSLASVAEMASNHRFIGPVVWSPSMDLPAWWDQVSQVAEPIAYINLGSTGNVELLPRIVEVCMGEGYVCLVASAGRMALERLPEGVYAAEFLPGTEAATLANVTICNGGATATQQALAVGCPVVGICSNLDQVLTMDGVKRRGVGVGFRASEFTEARIRQELAQLRNSPGMSSRLAEMKAECSTWDAASKFREVLLEAVATHIAN